MISFQSSPAPEGECNPGRRGSCPTGTRCFNPHPPLRASATSWVSTVGPSEIDLFQSSPAPEGECNYRIGEAEADGIVMFQSSPAPEGECNFQTMERTAGFQLVSILTRP